MVGGVRGGVMGAIAVMGCIAGVDVLVSHSLLPLAAIFVEPAKVLFLNNAINHGIFTPIGAEQAVATGKSIMYMLEANPVPGLGVLLAYLMFAKDKIVFIIIGVIIATVVSFVVASPII